MPQSFVQISITISLKFVGILGVKQTNLYWEVVEAWQNKLTHIFSLDVAR